MRTVTRENTPMAMDGTALEVNTVSVNGTTLAYREHGDGEPVVFVHGAVSDLRTWMPQLEEIGKSHRAVAYSARSARPNADTPSGTDDELLSDVEDLAAFLPAIGASPAHLVGNSSGAFICLLAAIRHPGLVRTLVLEEPPVTTLFVSPRPGPLELLRLLVRRPRTATAIARMGATALGPAEKAFRRGDDDAAMLAFLRGVLGREHLQRLPEARHQQARENLSGLKAMLLGAGLPAIADDEVRGVSTRTLLVCGERSPAFGHRLIDRLEELLPEATRIVIPSASHLVHEDNAAAVNEAIVAFLAQRQADAEPMERPPA